MRNCETRMPVPDSEKALFYRTLRANKAFTIVMRFVPKWRLRRPAEDAKTVYVSEKFGVRSLHIGSDTVQSSMRIARPIDLELSYTRSMMACLLFNPAPRTVLMVGLGGGSVAKFVYHHLPQTGVRVLEVDPQVMAIARQCFLVPPDDARFRVTVGDGAAHMAQSGTAADIIMVDGYNAESHVEELATREFYADCRARLTPRGVLVVICGVATGSSTMSCGASKPYFRMAPVPAGAQAGQRDRLRVSRRARARCAGTIWTGVPWN